MLRMDNFFPCLPATTPTAAPERQLSHGNTTQRNVTARNGTKRLYGAQLLGMELKQRNVWSATARNGMEPKE